MDYLRQKIENANGELAILEDNLQFLSDKKYHERLKHIARRMESIILHLELDLHDYSEEE